MAERDIKSVTSEAIKDRGPSIIQNPILVGGENRSGTTLSGIVLDSHPDVVMGSEIDFISPSFEKIRQGELDDPEKRFLRQLGRFGINRDQALSVLSDTVEDLEKVPLTYQERCLFMQRIGEYRASTENVGRWGFQIQRQIGSAELIEFALPDARFVHVVRDGRDVAASHLKLSSSRTWAYKSIEEVAKGWSSLIRKVKAIDNLDIVEVRYENIIHHPESTLRSLLGDLALTWSKRVMEHSSVKHDLLDTPVDHPSAKQISRPLYADSIGSYARTLNKEQINAFERIAGDELELLGYK